MDTEAEEQCGICAEQLPAAACTRTPMRNSEERERAASRGTSDDSYAASAGPSGRVRNSSEQPGSQHVSNTSVTSPMAVHPWGVQWRVNR
jgi:hypothetical protein